MNDRIACFRITEGVTVEQMAQDLGGLEIVADMILCLRGNAVAAVNEISRGVWGGRERILQVSRNNILLLEMMRQINYLKPIADDDDLKRLEEIY